MKLSFLDHLTEVSIGDIVKLNKPEMHVPQELVSWLFKEGYRLVDTEKFPGNNNVGEGAFASVFIKNDNDKFVLKVARKPDPCWVDYINYARKSRSPHVPRVPSFKTWKFKGSGDDRRKAVGGVEGEYFLAMIERLHPLKANYDKIKKEDIGILSYLYFHAGTKDLEKVINKLSGRQLLRPDILKMSDEFRDSNHPFIKAMDDLYKLAPEETCGIDLHEWNIMVRLPERELVITDPAYSKEYI